MRLQGPNFAYLIVRMHETTGGGHEAVLCQAIRHFVGARSLHNFALPGEWRANVISLPFLSGLSVDRYRNPRSITLLISVYGTASPHYERDIADTGCYPATRLS